MSEIQAELIESARRKFARFRALSEKHGESEAWETMLVGYPEAQKERMGPMLAMPTLAGAFRAAIPFFAAVGMEMDVVDISNRGIDAVLEIQRVCPYMEVCRAFGFDTPCHVICELDMAATRLAFPEMNGEILCRIAHGSPVCIFKYERTVKTGSDATASV
jgi:predicted ArsR family transcriptional regulator